MCSVSIRIQGDMNNFDTFLEEHFLDSHGVVYTMIDAGTL